MTASGGMASGGSPPPGSEVDRALSRRRWRLRPLELVLGVATALVVAATLGGYAILQESDAAARQDRLRADLAGASATLERLVDGAGSQPAAVAGLFIGVDPNKVTESTFDGFTRPLLDTGAVSALEWVPRVRASEVGAFVAARRRELPDFSLREFGSNGIEAAGARPEYFPVGFVQPLRSNLAALGVDLGSQPTRAAALELARDSGTYAATGPIHLAQGGVGFLVFYPTYVDGIDPGTVEDRRRQLIGFGLALLRPDVLLERAIDPSHFHDVGVGLFDLGPTTAPPSATGGLLASRADPYSGVRAPATLAASGMVESTAFDYAGRHLVLIASAGSAYAPATGGASTEWALLALGSLAALLLIAYGVVRRRIDLRLERAAARLRSVVEAAPEAFVGLDARGSVVDWSAQASNLFGLPREVALGRALRDMIAFDHDADDPPLPTAAHGASHVSGRVRLSDGRTFPVQVTMAAASDGADWCIACFVRDATDEVSAREERARVSRVEAIGELTGRVAHDFNNLLGIVVGSLEGLRRHVGEDPVVDEHIEAAMSATARGAEITRALLAAARRQVLDAQEHDLRELVADAVPLIGRAVSPGVRIRTELPDEPAVARLDATAFSNALINLARNADDAMPRGGTLVVRVDLEDQGVVVSVADDGRGMTEDVAAHAFDPLFTTRPGGTGLGLAIVDEFARRSGGTAEIESRLGLGTTVRLTLPATVSTPDVLVVQPTAASEPQPVATERLHVVVVDDEPILRTFSARWLTELGYDVTTAASGTEAMAAIERAIDASRPPDALVSDVLMPGEYGGGELARRARLLLPDLAVVLVSGFVGAELEPLVADGYAILEKPFRREELGEAVAAEVARRRVVSDVTSAVA